MRSVKALYLALRQARIIGRGFAWVLHGGRGYCWSIIHMRASISSSFVWAWGENGGVVFLAEKGKRAGVGVLYHIAALA